MRDSVKANYFSRWGLTRFRKISATGKSSAAERGGHAENRVFSFDTSRKRLRTTVMPVKFSDLELAFDFVSSDPALGDHEAFVCRQTGKVYWRAEDIGDLEDVPDDIDDEEKYLPVPDKRELGLGKSMVLDFAREYLPDDFHEVRHIFSKRHAYRNFRTLLLRRRALDRWYEFESKTTKKALQDWCEQNSIEIVD
jgi:hypothetical protein